MELTQIVSMILILVAVLVVAYWVSYTRRLKTWSHVGTQEGIAVATQAKERRGRFGSAV